MAATRAAGANLAAVEATATVSTTSDGLDQGRPVVAVLVLVYGEGGSIGPGRSSRSGGGRIWIWLGKGWIKLMWARSPDWIWAEGETACWCTVEKWAAGAQGRSGLLHRLKWAGSEDLEQGLLYRRG
jgi:hypothetical protein